MTALLKLSVGSQSITSSVHANAHVPGASMQAQMEEKLASLNLKSGNGLPASPATRALNGQRLDPADSPISLPHTQPLPPPR